MAYAFGHPKNVPAGATRNVPILCPEQAAVLVVDVQKYCSLPHTGCHKEVGRDEQNYFFSAVDRMVHYISKLLASARKGKCEVIYTYIESLTKDGRDASLDYKLSGPLFVAKGDSGAEILDAIAPDKQRDEILIPKTSCSVFQSTNIDYVLRNLGVRHLIVVGQLTNKCVESAVRDATDLGYLVTVVGEACAANSAEEHQHGLANMKGFARLASVETVCQELESDTCWVEPAPRTSASARVAEEKTNHSVAAPTTSAESFAAVRRNLMSSESLVAAMLNTLKGAGIKAVRFTLCDSSAQLQSKTMTLSCATPASLAKGIAFVGCTLGRPCCGDYIAPGAGLGPWNTLRLVPSFDSLCIVPYQPTVANVFGFLCDETAASSKGETAKCDGTTTGDGGNNGVNISPLCPRGCLQRAMDGLARKGFSVHVGVEIEIVLFQIQSGEPIDHRNYCSAITMDHPQVAGFLSEAEDALTRQNVLVELMHSESCNGQFEIVLKYKKCALSMADAILSARQTLHAVATKHDLRVSFVPKLTPTEAGSGMHVNISLHSASEQNKTSPGDYTLPVKTATDHFLAGVLQHLAGLVAVTTPTENSFKRIVPGYWCGAYICWGYDNKEATIRRVCDSDTGDRFEVKAVDSTCNPYLAFATIITAGLDGIERQLPLPAPVQCLPQDHPDAPARLPATLAAALDHLENDKVLVSALGERLGQAYIAVKREETKHFAKLSLEEEIATMGNLF